MCVFVSAIYRLRHFIGRQQQWFLSVEFICFFIPQAFIPTSFLYILYKHRKRRKTAAQRLQSGAPLSAVASNRPTSMQAVADEGPRTVRRSTKGSSEGFLILTLLTMAVILFWTPSNIYYGIQCFTPYSNQVFSQASTMLRITETIIDPILFSIGVPELRRLFVSVFRSR